ncbi:hypothetical protein [Haloarcula amylovorans]|uniref:hypothetical protein n=1 Tax=Haloarcula amylovorans TaxID=2562280 RepID=UPI0010763E69|nr:hypothetical protein [Halomicroarcula amylolytica]
MTATACPAVGVVVVLTEVASAPRLLVTGVDDAYETITGVLLTDLAAETRWRLAASVDDRRHREDVTIAVRRTTALAQFCVPCGECRPADGPCSQGWQSWEAIA